MDCAKVRSSSRSENFAPPTVLQVGGAKIFEKMFKLRRNENKTLTTV
jgi:hypothetical protein